MTSRIVCLGLALFLTPILGVTVEDPAGIQEDEAVLRNAGLKTDDRALLDFFRKRTPDAETRKQIKTLVEQLDSQTFAARQEAARKLVELGPAALTVLRAATKGTSLETTRRAEQCIEEIERATSLQLPAAAARLLAARKPDGAAGVLLAYLPFADDETIEEEVSTALLVLGVRDGRPDPVLVAALKDDEPRRRAAAALAVGRSTEEAERTAVRRLLNDPDPKVRLQAARGLVAGRDKEAVPVLIALLADAPLQIALQAEDVLARIAGDKAPAMSLGGTDRQKYRDVWASWWSANSPQVDLAKIEAYRIPRLPAIAPVPANRRPDVIFVPTPQDVVTKALELARVRKTDVVYDLGCGDGRVVVTAAKKYGSYGFGFEIDPERVKDSLEYVKKHKVERLVTIKHADVFKLDLREATVVYLYLLPSLNVKLIPQLDRCKPGTRIVSHDFDMQGVKPDQVLDINAKDDNGNVRTHKLYLWTIPLKKER
jgi:SAM-dependent methyltransferase